MAPVKHLVDEETAVSLDRSGTRRKCLRDASNTKIQ